jgi:hypothetical protein
LRKKIAKWSAKSRSLALESGAGNVTVTGPASSVTTSRNMPGLAAGGVPGGFCCGVGAWGVIGVSGYWSLSDPVVPFENGSVPY